VSADLSSSKSIYNFYKNIIKYKKENYNTIKEKFNYIRNENGLVVYRKNNLEVICNFTNKEIDYFYESCSLSNYHQLKKNKVLPYQIIILRDNEI